jgi:urease accessory protein
MTRSPKILLAVSVGLAVAGLSTAAFAHPGHGSGLTGGLAHPFTGLDHMLAMVAVGLWASQLGRPAMWLLPAVFPAVMAAGALLGASGVALPLVEPGIMVSVLVLGAAIALALRPPLAASVAVIALFALLHGHAHGAEMPAAGSALLYGAGFIAATLALHGVGLAIGSAIGALAFRPAGVWATRTAGAAIVAAGLVLLVLR